MKYILIIAALLIPTLAEACPKRSYAAKVAFAKKNACPGTGLNKLPCKGFVIDHIKPLACGGWDGPSNMQWMNIADAKAKDKWERQGC